MTKLEEIKLNAWATKDEERIWLVERLEEADAIINSAIKNPKIQWVTPALWFLRSLTGVWRKYKELEKGFNEVERILPTKPKGEIDLEEGRAWLDSADAQIDAENEE